MSLYRLYIHVIVLSVCTLLFPLQAQDEGMQAPIVTEQKSYSWMEVVEYAQQHLPQEGQLVVKSDGYAYLKVDDAYIHTLYPMLGLAEEGYKKPPYFRTNEAPGAHVSVFYSDEQVLPDEVGETFHFELQNIIIIQASKTAFYAILQVRSPELEALRVKYRLSNKLHGHEFHISLAKKTVSAKTQ